MQLVVTWQDIRGLDRFKRQIRDLNEKFPKVLPRIVNQVGDRARTRVGRALIQQTGLEGSVIRKAVENTKRAFSGQLTYDLRSRGGNIRLKYFQPKETEVGVSAKPFNQRQVFVGSFMKGGAFPDRKVVPRFGGHVFHRLSNGLRTDGTVGKRITVTRSGVIIPKSMIEGMARAAFIVEAEREMPIRVEKVIRKLIG